MSFTISRSRGFTLAEMLIVIAIIGLLVAIIFPAFLPAKSKARDNKRVSDLSQIQLALEAYFNRCSAYPSVLSVTNPTSDCLANTAGSITFGSFISSIPVPPTGVTNETVYDYVPSGSSYGNADYILHIKLENKVSLPYSGLLDSQLTTYKTAYSVSPSWQGATGHCYTNTTTNPYDYCIGPN